MTYTTDDMTQSVGPMATDSVGVMREDLATGGRNMVSNMTDGMGILRRGGLGGYKNSRLSYPNTLETDNDEHTHFIVFHIYSEMDPSGNKIDGLTPEKLINHTRFENAGWGGYAGGGALGLLGGGVGARYANKGMAQSNNAIVKNKGTRGIVSLGVWATTTYVGAKLGEWIGKQAADDMREDHADVEAVRERVDKEYKETADAEFKSTGRLMRFGEARYKQKETIALYMPQKIQSLSLLEYESNDMSFMQNLINDKIAGLETMLVQQGSKIVDTVAGFLNMNTNFDSYLMASARIAQNPRKQLMFREPISRKFEFQFNFSPRNEDESVRAYDIIKMFKKHAYPVLNRTYGTGAFYTFPAEFEIEYQTINAQGQPVTNDWLNKIGRCALREINVDYASSGSFSTFENGAPTNMVLSLTFEEMALLDSGMIDRGY